MKTWEITLSKNGPQKTSTQAADFVEVDPHNNLVFRSAWGPEGRGPIIAMVRAQHWDDVTLIEADE